MDRSGTRRLRVFRPDTESCEGRVVLSTFSFAQLRQEGFFNPVRPNTPALPYGVASNAASFIDTTAHIFSGNTIFIATKTLVAPYSTLNGNGGFIKIGLNAIINDNSTILANPQHLAGGAGVFIGNNTIIDFGATVRGPATIGSLVPGAAPTYVGANALIDGATIEPGASVGALARVGPGVTVPTGIRVLPGQNVTTNAEASNPALGKVTKVTAADLASLTKLLSNSAALVSGYINVYQGNSATGASIGTPVKTVFQGNLATISGSSAQPGTSFEPGATGPTFASPRGPQLPGLFANFRARATGGANFHSRPSLVAHHLGRGNSIRADQGQPINFASFPTTGNFVTINSPGSGQVSIGTGLQVANNAVLVGGSAGNLTLGNNVNIGSGAVVASSKLGDNVTIGSRAYVAQSTIPAGTTIPDGTIMVQNKVIGTIQW
jgi:carbonic anhydrase/acetyltransferase-like protein (isoleucine patch superfamily)